jgi:hypothetical protein
VRSDDAVSRSLRNSSAALTRAHPAPGLVATQPRVRLPRLESCHHTAPSCPRRLCSILPAPCALRSASRESSEMLTSRICPSCAPLQTARAAPTVSARRPATRAASPAQVPLPTALLQRMEGLQKSVGSLVTPRSRARGVQMSPLRLRGRRCRLGLLPHLSLPEALPMKIVAAGIREQLAALESERARLSAALPPTAPARPGFRRTRRRRTRERLLTRMTRTR